MTQIIRIALKHPVEDNTLLKVIEALRYDYVREAAPISEPVREGPQGAEAQPEPPRGADGPAVGNVARQKTPEHEAADKRINELLSELSKAREALAVANGTNADLRATVKDQAEQLEQRDIGKVTRPNKGLHRLYVCTAMQHLEVLDRQLKELDRGNINWSVTAGALFSARSELLCNSPAYQEAAWRIQAGFFVQDIAAGPTLYYRDNSEPVEL